MALSFIEYFRDLNADLATSIQSRRSTRTLFELAMSATADTAMRDMKELLATLSRQKEYPVHYIFDEHNEFYRKQNGGHSYLANHSEFLGRFTRWTGPTSGVRNNNND